MFVSGRMKITLILIAAVFILSSNVFNNALGEMASVPLPPSAEEIRQEVKKIAGSAFTFNYYTSEQDTLTIKNFYRSTLSNLGWKEKEPLKDLAGVTNFQVNSSLADNLSLNLIFEKDDGQMLIINFLPQVASSDGKTRFTIAEGKVDFKAQSTTQQDFVPELLAKPKKDITPTYPGASLINLNEDATYLRAGYFTKDDIEAVSSFYKNNMPGYGWNLITEKPIQEVAAAENNYDLYKYCPQCPKDIGFDMKSIKTRLTELKFSNTNGDVCSIVVSTRSSAESGFDNMTVILVNYAEKKK